MAAIDEIDITSLLFQEGSAPSTPASTKWRAYFKTDGLYVIDDAGTETGPLGTGGGSTFVGVRARTSADQSLGTDTMTYIPFDGTDDYDTDSMHDPSTNNTRLTVPAGEGGKYHVTASAFTSHTYGDGFCVLRKNGTTIVATGVMADHPGSVGAAYASATLDLSAGDYIEFGIRVENASKSVTDAGVAEPFFEMYKVG